MEMMIMTEIISEIQKKIKTVKRLIKSSTKDLWSKFQVIPDLSDYINTYICIFSKSAVQKRFMITED